VVVESGDGSSVVRPISVTLPLSGLAVLEATGLELTVVDAGFGPAVCAIEGEGCPADDCFCNPDAFWNYSYWDGEAWVSYPVGAATSVISQTGAVEGWRWGGFEAVQAVTPAEADAALRALDWLQAQQQEDGGMGSMGGAVETMMAMGANGITAAEWVAPESGRSLEHFGRYNQARFSRSDLAAPGKLAVALAAANACTSRGSVLPDARFDEESGAYGPSSGSNAWGILGTLAISRTVEPAALETLAATQDPSGGWEWQAGFGPDSNTTALALQALIAAGEPVTATTVVSGLAFLKSVQQEDGGFAYDVAGGYGSDANSTSYALQALAAAGEDPAADAWRAEGEDSPSPVDYLLSLQLEDGALEWQADGGANAAATQQAVAALLRRPLPIAVQPVDRCRSR
jgi:hypothetical protein